MKTLYSICSFLFLTSLFLPACKKDEVRTIIKQGTAPTLTASSSTIVLDTAKKAQNAVTFNWNAADFGYQAATGYSLQISRKGSNFTSATTTELNLGTAKTASFTVADFNKELMKILTPGQATDVEVRVKADLGTSAVAPVYSNALTYRVTPYRDIITYAWPQAITLAGNFQGWDPKTGPQIVATNAATAAPYEKFEGFIEFNNASPEFKMVKGNDWSAGDFGSAGTDKLGNGGANLALTGGAGTYLVQADIAAMTWSSVKINSWGIIGDAVPVTGWNSDKDMTYDAATKTWKITLDLVAGAFKFRANDAWSVDLGDKGNDGKPELGGDNILITAAGNYTITLDISTAGNWYYSVKKN